MMDSSLSILLVAALFLDFNESGHSFIKYQKVWEYTDTKVELNEA